MEKKHIYIIQMYSQTIPSKVVKSITNYKYSHIGLCLDKKCDTIYTFGRRNLNSFWNGGFIVERKNGIFYQKFNETICRIYELEINKNQYSTIKEVLEHMKQNNSIYKYDFFGMFLRLFYIPVSFKDHYVCSQFVAELLEKSNIYKFDKKTCFIKPKDFEKIQGIKEIYSGTYLSY